MQVLVSILILVLTFGAYLQHLVTTWANDQLLLFICGAFVPPIGVVHGWLIWLGFVS